jgi:hypothetical protein
MQLGRNWGERVSGPGVGRGAVQERVRVMLDSNIFDRIIESPGLVERLQSLRAAGLLDLIVTHVQEDELAGAPDAKRRAYPPVPRRVVKTSVAVLGVSRLGKARLGEGQAGGLDFGVLAGPNSTHVKDAVIALSAAGEVDVLVTSDERLANRVKAEAQELRVWTFEEFKRQVWAT